MRSPLYYLVLGLAGAVAIAGAALIALGFAGVAWWAGWLA